MAKSIEEIMMQMESERIHKLNEEQSRLDNINQQRDLARKEWTKTMRMYENLSSVAPAAAAAAGGNNNTDTTPIGPGIIDGITYSLRNDNFWHIIDLDWLVNPLSVEPNWNNTTISIVAAGIGTPTISNITIFNSGNAGHTGASFEVSKTGAGVLTGNDIITISVLTTTGQYATGSIGPLDFRS